MGEFSLYRTSFAAFLAFFFSLYSPPNAHAQQASDEFAPEPQATVANQAKHSGRVVTSKKWMIAAANPLAVRAGAAVLARGGNAADAAVVVQTVLGLVEPQSSGLGGGAFLVYWDAATESLTTLDGRETAPSGATPLLFQDSNGKTLNFFDAVVGPRSVGVPGTPALLGEMHKRWGKKPWTELLQPAIKLAREGFIVSPRLAKLVAGDKKRLNKFAATSKYFYPAGEAIQSGRILKNPAYAETLAMLQSSSASVFYQGQIADQIVATIKLLSPATIDADRIGMLTAVDLANYQIKERAPVCAIYRSYDICGMGPPSSGAITVGQILGMIEHFDLAAGPKDASAWRLIGDASRLAFADRGRYIADSDFVPVPVKGLVEKDYLKQRAKLLVGQMAIKTALPGRPTWDHASLQADDDAIELPSTSHFSIVDAAGNVVSMTTTIENGFGSRIMVGGFLLNNELTDFSFRSHKNGIPVANRVEPDKRPRSSMAPTIVMKDGNPVLAIGSPGGSRIIGYVAKTIVAWIDWKMDIQTAIATPHLINRFGTYDLEKGTTAESMHAPLESLGYKTKIRSLNSGLHGIAIRPDGLTGGADPRREGIVLGGD